MVRTVAKNIKVPGGLNEGNRYNLSFDLLSGILKISEVVASGLASSIKRENATNAVAVISDKELTEVPTQTLDQQLAGKFAGVAVNKNHGAPGSGMSVNLRGIATINAASQPLYILDGVILDNFATQSNVNAVTRAGSNQDNPVNRIADLVPSDIESINIFGNNNGSISMYLFKEVSRNAFNNDRRKKKFRDNYKKLF